MYELNNEMVAGRKYYAKLELDDGTVLTNYGDEAVGIASVSISSTLCASESLSIGGVNAASVTVVLETGAALENQRFTLYLGQEFDSAVEWAPVGIFTGTKAEFSEGRLTVEAWDDLYFAGGTYTPSDSVTGSCTLAAALADVCEQAGLSFSGTAPSLTVAGMPTGLTCSAAIGYLAALCGANACMDREGYLVFRQFTESGQTLGTDDCYSGGMVFKTSDFTVASLTNTLEVETTGDDGETTTESVEVERTTGAAGGCIALTNPLMTEDNIDTAWDVVKGFAYRPATLTVVGQLAVDVGDVLTVTDATGAVYSVPVMTHTLEYDGGLKSTLTAAGESESQQSAAVSGPVAQQIRELTTKVTDTKVLVSGKSAVYYATTAPSAEDYVLSVNDIWFDTTGGNYAMYYWDGSAWVAAPFGTDALGDDIITAAKIVAGAVTAEKLNVSELSAITANLGTITGGSININNRFTVDSEGNLTATSGAIAGFTIGSSGIYKGTASLSSDESGVYVGTDGIKTASSSGSALHTTYYSKYQYADSNSYALMSGSGMSLFANENDDGSWLDIGINFYVDDTEMWQLRSDSTGAFVLGYNDGESRAVFSANSIELKKPVAVSGNLTVNGALYVPNYGIALANNYGVHHYNTSGSLAKLEYLNSSNNFILGNSGYPTYLYGNGIYAKSTLYAGNTIRIPEIQHGNVSITPSGVNTPTGKAVTFSTTFSGTPDVIANAATTAPGTVVLGTGTASPSSTGVTIYVTRTSTTATTVRWVAAY